ncbi:hypothetical protein BU17DRAFT_74903 [Hysterangium stoloniferum]|nr:hypothetical protein BU17DRAFT_74903 [Hysterangium stoloniferum]
MHRVLLFVGLFVVWHLWHPIPQLINSAEANFTTMMSNQSTTLEEAVAEYRRRYNRNPPKGFDDWFAFAVENDAKIIDEYDSMMKDFSPFWSLTGEEIRRRALQVGLLPSIDLVRIENGKSVTLNITKDYRDKERNARANGFRRMMEKFEHKLPDMDFPINTKAEGRVLVSWEDKTYPELALQNSSAGIENPFGDEFTAAWKNDGNVWEAFRRTCHPSSQARRLFGSRRNPLSLGGSAAQRVLPYPSQDLLEMDDPDFDFALRPDDDFDFCSNPWARYLHGHLFSDWRTIPALYPVFSPSKAPGYSDLLIPSHYYWGPTTKYTYGWDPKNKVIHDVDKSEVAWENKTDKIFWRGATTGGGSTPSGFIASYQRHRCPQFFSVLSSSNVSKTVIFAHPHTSEMVGVAVPIEALNTDIMDTGFTNAVGCNSFPGGCKGLQNHYHFTNPVPLNELWRHKYLVDVDGMGYSARVMALLASQSALVKATVYREFYTDWIQPWYVVPTLFVLYHGLRWMSRFHYIPLSQSYKELYNIHAFFSGPSPSALKAANVSTTNTSNPYGDKLLRRIAGAGREWQRTIGRKVDMEVYVYRLCLEYGRLWADDRDAMSYTGQP